MHDYALMLLLCPMLNAPMYNIFNSIFCAAKCPENLCTEFGGVASKIIFLRIRDTQISVPNTKANVHSTVAVHDESKNE